MAGRKTEIAQQYLAHTLRPYLYEHTERFPWQNYVKIVYNDALTFDHKTSKGGLKANFQFRQNARAPQNKSLQLLTQELIYRKKFETDIVFDKLSLGDYFATAAFLVIKEAEGPNILGDIDYGRKDVTSEAEAGDASLIPNESNFKASLASRGFTNDEIVALASIEAFGLVRDPVKVDSSKYPKLDNFYYKQLATGKGQILQHTLCNDSELKEIVDKFAQDQKAYHEAFGRAFIKLTILGHDQTQLTNVENLLEDHPFKHFMKMHY